MVSNRFPTPNEASLIEKINALLPTLLAPLKKRTATPSAVEKTHVELHANLIEIRFYLIELSKENISESQATHLLARKKHLIKMDWGSLELRYIEAKNLLAKFYFLLQLKNGQIQIRQQKLTALKNAALLLKKPENVYENLLLCRSLSAELEKDMELILLVSHFINELQELSEKLQSLTKILDENLPKFLSEKMKVALPLLKALTVQKNKLSPHDLISDLKKQLEKYLSQKSVIIAAETITPQEKAFLQKKQELKNKISVIEMEIQAAMQSLNSLLIPMSLSKSEIDKLSYQTFRLFNEANSNPKIREVAHGDSAHDKRLVSR